MEAKDYSIMHCKDGNLYINRSQWNVFRSDDSKCLSEEDIKSIESWIEQNNEYVRKDTFIEKVIEWWMDNFVYTDDVEIKYDTIQSFKDSMKGE